MKEYIDRKQVVVKHNDLIQKAKFNLTVTQQKLIAYLISQIKPTDTEFKPYYISVQDFCKLTGTKTQSFYSEFQDIVDDIDNKCFWFETEAEIRKFRWFAETAYQKGKGQIKLILAPTLREYLLELQEHYTSYQIFNILALKSKYAIRLFELFKSYEFQKNKEIELEELKVLLCAENYNNYKDFKKRVLEKAIEEINIYTILNVSYIANKKGKKVDTIIFTIEKKKNIETPYMNTIRELNRRNNEIQGQLCLDDIENLGTLTKNNKPIKIYMKEDK